MTTLPPKPTGLFEAREAATTLSRFLATTATVYATLPEIADAAGAVMDLQAWLDELATRCRRIGS